MAVIEVDIEEEGGVVKDSPTRRGRGQRKGQGLHTAGRVPQLCSRLPGASHVVVIDDGA